MDGPPRKRSKAPKDNDVRLLLLADYYYYYMLYSQREVCNNVILISEVQVRVNVSDMADGLPSTCDGASTT